MQCLDVDNVQKYFPCQILNNNLSVTSTFVVIIIGCRVWVLNIHLNCGKITWWHNDSRKKVQSNYLDQVLFLMNSFSNMVCLCTFKYSNATYVHLIWTIARICLLFGTCCILSDGNIRNTFDFRLPPIIVNNKCKYR